MTYLLDEVVRQDLESLGCRVEPCGSRVTCDPPPVDTDEDWLVEVYQPSPDVVGYVDKVLDYLMSLDFVVEAGGEYSEVQRDREGFTSLRKNDANLIVTGDHVFARSHRLATKLCKQLNLMDKQHRKAVFQALLYERK